jgi:hypothetical protein
VRLGMHCKISPPLGALITSCNTPRTWRILQRKQDDSQYDRLKLNSWGTIGGISAFGGLGVYS